MTDEETTRDHRDNAKTCQTAPCCLQTCQHHVVLQSVIHMRVSFTDVEQLSSLSKQKFAKHIQWGGCLLQGVAGVRLDQQPRHTGPPETGLKLNCNADNIKGGCKQNIRWTSCSIHYSRQAWDDQFLLGHLNISDV